MVVKRQSLSPGDLWLKCRVSYGSIRRQEPRKGREGAFGQRPINNAIRMKQVDRKSAGSEKQSGQERGIY